MADRPGVGEVVDARFAVLGQCYGDGKEVVQDAVGIGDVDDVGVFGYFGYEGAGVEVVRDGHADAEDEVAGVVLQDVFNAGFGVGVEAAGEVWAVGFGEGGAEEGAVVGGVG